MVTYERVVDYFTTQRDSAMAQIEQFAKQVVESPTYALEWADEHFQNAANHWAACYVLEGLEQCGLNGLHESDALSSVTQAIKSDLLRKAGDFPSSTSLSSNHVDNCKRVALAKAYEMLDR